MYRQVLPHLIFLATLYLGHVIHYYLCHSVSSPLFDRQGKETDAQNVEWLAHCHIASKWQRQNLNLDTVTFSHCTALSPVTVPGCLLLCASNIELEFKGLTPSSY